MKEPIGFEDVEGARRKAAERHRSIEKDDLNVAAAATGGADERADDGLGGIDHAALAFSRHTREGAVLEGEDDILFELVEPPANPTRYDELIQRGPRQCLKSELDRYIGFLVRQVFKQLEPPLPEGEVRSICAGIVMRNWRPVKGGAR